VDTSFVYIIYDYTRSGFYVPTFYANSRNEQILRIVTEKTGLTIIFLEGVLFLKIHFEILSLYRYNKE
jgi:hypothetical protein